MSDFKYLRILQAVTASPWAILPQKLADIQEFLSYRATDGRFSDEEIAERLQASGFAAASGRSASPVPNIAVIPIIGTIVPRGGMFTESSGAVSVQTITSRFRSAMNDPDIGHVIFDVDSPGGQVGGVEELASEIYQARGSKPITAVVNHLTASAAYWLASATDEIAVPPSGEVGSIGVFAMHQDVSGYLEREGISTTLISAGEFKTEGNPFQPLDEVALGAIQARVDEYYDLFVTAVARGRGAKKSTVVAGFGQGRVVGADQAIALGMADRVATFDEVISGINARSGRRVWAMNKAQRERRLRANSR